MKGIAVCQEDAAVRKVNDFLDSCGFESSVVEIVKMKGARW